MLRSVIWPVPPLYDYQELLLGNHRMLFYLLRWTGSGCQGYGFYRTFLLWGYHVYSGYQPRSLVPKVCMHTIAWAIVDTVVVGSSSASICGNTRYSNILLGSLHTVLTYTSSRELYNFCFSAGYHWLNGLELISLLFQIQASSCSSYGGGSSSSNSSGSDNLLILLYVCVYDHLIGFKPSRKLTVTSISRLRHFYHPYHHLQRSLHACIFGSQPSSALLAI